MSTYFFHEKNDEQTDGGVDGILQAWKK
jgi:hypothetical protein